MGTLVLHAGMGKAGSTSIQTWLQHASRDLRENGIGLLAPDPGAPEDELRLKEHESGTTGSNRIAVVYGSGRRRDRSVLESLFAQLEAALERHRVTVVTAEALERYFCRVDEDFLGRLEQLAGVHRVRVAYYVRPQHTALEARWRQWGFRLGQKPSEYLGARSRVLHYFDTYASVAHHAPNVSFEPRPFRSDLLDGGDPVTDFAGRFLDLRNVEPAASAIWTNRGLPLEVVNVLRHAPPGRFWSSSNDNDRLDLIKDVLAGLESDEAQATRESRRVLQGYCRETFEPGNARLIETLGWNTDHFVPPVEGRPLSEEPRLETMDELWQPQASETILESLYSVLDRVIAAPRADRGEREPRSSWRGVARRRLSAGPVQRFGRWRERSARAR